jgi:hypothetical protein
MSAGKATAGLSGNQSDQVCQICVMPGNIEPLIRWHLQKGFLIKVNIGILEMVQNWFTQSLSRS